MVKPDLILAAIQASLKAGDKILEIYNTNFEVDFKSDCSPLTEADLAAHNIIKDELSKTELELLSEEGKETPYEHRASWIIYWLVDPLDGTKEFVSRNGEFTVNIALIENHEIIGGVIYVPVYDCLYFALQNRGSFKLNDARKLCQEKSIEEIQSISKKLPLYHQRKNYTVVASRSHYNEQTSDFINELKAKHKNLKTVSKGSSLKLCMIAEGNAALYPRFGTTMEWDIAAGNAIIKYAGGEVRDLNGNFLKYNKADLRNPYFIASL